MKLNFGFMKTNSNRRLNSKTESKHCTRAINFVTKMKDIHFAIVYIIGVNEPLEEAAFVGRLNMKCVDSTHR